MQNRTRKIPLSVRLTEEEDKQIKQKIKQSGLSKTEYVIRSCSNNHIISAEVKDTLFDTYKDMKKIGNNINQIAKQMNAGYQANISELNQVIKAFDSIQKDITKIIEVVI